MKQDDKNFIVIASFFLLIAFIVFMGVWF